MSIRSIDYQTIIPKAPEVQKIKHAESQNPQNNSAINMHKQQEQNQKDLKRVNDVKKTYDGKINRDNPQKEQKQNKDDDEQEKKKQKNKQSIDIRI